MKSETRGFGATRRDRSCMTISMFSRSDEVSGAASWRKSPQPVCHHMAGRPAPENKKPSRGRLTLLPVGLPLGPHRTWRTTLPREAGWCGRQPGSECRISLILVCTQGQVEDGCNRVPAKPIPEFRGPLAPSFVNTSSGKRHDLPAPLPRASLTNIHVSWIPRWIPDPIPARPCAQKVTIPCVPAGAYQFAKTRIRR